MTSSAGVLVRVPGRVNLIGDHTDYTGGLVLPMAIDRFIELRGTVGGGRVRLRSADDPLPVDLPLVVERPDLVEPAWGRYVAGVVAEMRPAAGLEGAITSTIPVGAGLSSSAALEVAAALALGFRGSPVELAQLCRRAEHRASGVPSGIMDQLAIAAGVDGHALLIDCAELTVEPVPLPEEAAVVVRFVSHRALATSAYAERVAQCAAAEAAIGPLRHASPADVARIADPLVRARATHVVGENQRVREFAAALRAGDLHQAGRLMAASHASLRDLYDTSTPQMDATVERLAATPGVFGARMTGGGFGGCIVVLAEHGAVREGWAVRAVSAAALVPS